MPEDRVPRTGFAIRNVVFDCKDPYGVATFWSDVFGYPIDHDDRPGNTVAIIVPPSGPMLYFEQVPEPKVVKNRVHICLQPDDLRDVAVQRVAELGGSIAADRRNADGTGWVVFADPEGNEFCVLRSLREREDTSG